MKTGANPPKRRKDRGLLASLLDGDDAGGQRIGFLNDGDPTRIREWLDTPAIVDLARSAATALHAAGLAPGARVALCLPTGPDFVAWFFGCLWMGAVPVPLPPVTHLLRASAISERLRAVVADCQPDAVIADAATAKHIRGLPLGPARLLDPRRRGRSTAAPPRAADEDATLALIQYTAGSTGDPKGVALSRGNVLANLIAMKAAMRPTSNDRGLSWLPFHHDMGLIAGMLLGLYSRIPVLYYSPVAFVTRPANWLRAISAHRITLSPAPHLAYGLCAFKVMDRDVAGLDLSSWRIAFDGAEPIRPDTVRAFVSRFARVGFDPKAYFPVYGLSEATVGVTFPELATGPIFDRVRRDSLARSRKATPAPASSADAAEFVSVGRPLDGLVVEIRDPTSGSVCPDRNVGEIWVHGPSVSAGYFRIGAQGERRDWLRTGDLGYQAEGRLFVVDRLKDLIICGGANFYPSDIERTVEAIEGARRGRTIAFGVPRKDLPTEGVVVATESRTLKTRSATEARIRQAVLTSFGLDLLDVVVLPAGALPTTANGKVMRSRCREDYLKGALASARAGAWSGIRSAVRRRVRGLR